MSATRAVEGLVDVREDRSGVWRNRALILAFARRDLKGRFKGTTVGWVWSLILPLATIVIYSVVFSVFIRVTPPDFGNGDTGIYGIWLLVGMVPWTFTLASITSGMPSLLGGGALLQKIFIPAYVPPAASTTAIAFQSSIELAIVLVVVGAVGNIGWTWLLIPVWAVMVVAFVSCTTYVLAVANVHYRDVAHLVTVGMQMLFFLTPIIYPLDMVPDTWKGIPVRDLLLLNPIAEFVTVGRNLIYDLHLPPSKIVMAMTIWTGLAVLVARSVHRRWGQDVVEMI